MFEQSENVAIAHLVGARAAVLLAVRGVASAMIGTGSKLMPLASAHAHGTMGSLAQAGYCLCIDYISMICEHVLLN